MKVQKPNLTILGGIRSFVERRPWSVLSWASGIIALTFMGYYGISALGNPPSIIGQQFVLSEFPPSNISPWFFGKPITWFSYATFLYWAFGLEAQRSHFLKFSGRTRRFLFVITALIAFGALYEIFFNFMIWSALEVLTNNCGAPPCNIDLITSPFPSRATPLNLVFATKVVVLVFGLSMYSLYFLHRTNRDIERRAPAPAPIPSYQREELYDLDTIKNVPIPARSYTSPVRSKNEGPEISSPDRP